MSSSSSSMCSILIKLLHTNIRRLCRVQHTILEQALAADSIYLCLSSRRDSCSLPVLFTV